jgi:hypothetical protein
MTEKAASTWQVSLLEIAEQIGKTPATTRVWMHRHCIRSTARVAVGERATRALYDGDLVKRHAASEVPTCPTCVTARRRVTSIASGPPVSGSRGQRQPPRSSPDQGDVANG